MLPYVHVWWGLLENSDSSKTKLMKITLILAYQFFLTTCISTPFITNNDFFKRCVFDFLSYSWSAHSKNLTHIIQWTFSWKLTNLYQTERNTYLVVKSYDTEAKMFLWKADVCENKNMYLSSFKWNNEEF